MSKYNNLSRKKLYERAQALLLLLEHVNCQSVATPSAQDVFLQAWVQGSPRCKTCIASVEKVWAWWWISCSSELPTERSRWPAFKDGCWDSPRLSCLRQELLGGLVVMVPLFLLLLVTDASALPTNKGYPQVRLTPMLICS